MDFPDTPEPAPLIDHWWWRPGWRPGRRTWTWHVTFDGADALHRLAAAHRRVLDVPGSTDDVADVLGPDGVLGEDDGFVPHVSLACSDRAGDASALVAALGRVTPATAAVRIAEVQLIRLGRDEHLCRWDEAHRTGLGGSSVPGPGAVSAP